MRGWKQNDQLGYRKGPPRVQERSKHEVSNKSDRGSSSGRVGVRNIAKEEMTGIAV